jgi:hypothetical protein
VYGCTSQNLNTHDSDKILRLVLSVGVGIHVMDGLPRRFFHTSAAPIILQCW